jgi:proline racemase
MKDVIITDVKQAKVAYDEGQPVHVDVNAKPLRFFVESSLGTISLDRTYGGNWFLVDDDCG